MALFPSATGAKQNRLMVSFGASNGSPVSLRRKLSNSCYSAGVNRGSKLRAFAISKELQDP
jgi:hypothetical protein